MCVRLVKLSSSSIQENKKSYLMLRDKIHINNIVVCTYILELRVVETLITLNETRQNLIK